MSAQRRRDQRTDSSASALSAHGESVQKKRALERIEQLLKRVKSEQEAADEKRNKAKKQALNKSRSERIVVGEVAKERALLSMYERARVDRFYTVSSQNARREVARSSLNRQLGGEVRRQWPTLTQGALQHLAASELAKQGVRPYRSMTDYEHKSSAPASKKRKVEVKSKGGNGAKRRKDDDGGDDEDDQSSDQRIVSARLQQRRAHRQRSSHESSEYEHI